MRQIRAQVAIVGAGPAGMAAAIELVRAGAKVVVLDEAPRAGGQIFRQPPLGIEPAPAGGQAGAAESPNHARGHDLLKQLAELKVEVLQGAQVWSAAPGRLDLEVEGEPAACAWEQLILATGAYDRSVAFPGWTLPGVITAGAAQVLVRGFLIKPGTRALVAGTGPLLLPTLSALVAARVEVVAALEASSRVRALKAMPGILGNRMRRREAMHYARVVLGGRLPYRMGWTIFAAHGEDQVESATIGRVDRRGRPRRETATDIDVDLVCSGFGLQPSIELARLLGCKMRHVEVRGGWLPGHDERMGTSVPGVRVAGEIAGIGGADVAMVEGRLAGLAAADALGLAGAAERAPTIARTQRERRRERRASDGLLRAFGMLPGLCELARDDTMVCRCEDVTLAQLREGVESCGRDLRTAKMVTRAGMGPCQGRVCQALIDDLLRHRLGGSAGPPPCPSIQVPVKPVSVETMLASTDAD